MAPTWLQLFVVTSFRCQLLCQNSSMRSIQSWNLEKGISLYYEYFVLHKVIIRYCLFGWWWLPDCHYRCTCSTSSRGCRRWATSTPSCCPRRLQTLLTSSSCRFVYRCTEKCVIGCVIPPLDVSASSRNPGLTFLNMPLLGALTKNDTYKGFKPP